MLLDTFMPVLDLFLVHHLNKMKSHFWSSQSRLRPISKKWSPAKVGLVDRATCLIDKAHFCEIYLC